MELLYKEVLPCGVQYKIFHLNGGTIIEKFCSCPANGKTCICFGFASEDKCHLFKPLNWAAGVHPWKLLDRECSEDIDRCHFIGPISRTYCSWQEFHEFRCRKLLESKEASDLKFLIKARAACFFRIGQ